MTPFTRSLCGLAILSMIGGCSLGRDDSHNWSTGYREVKTSAPAVDASGQYGTTLIVPAKCRTDIDAQDQEDVVSLPSGCANDLNLQRMVVQPSDLIRGRDMGPARAKPMADAARDVLENSRERAASRRERVEGSYSQAAGAGLPSVSSP